MNTFINLLRIFINILPMLITGIKALEEAIPGRGKGELKLAAIRIVLETIAESVDDLGVNFEKLWSITSKIIDKLVGAFNEKGELPA